MATTIIITPQLAIPDSELQFKFARSGGKGGQNVNKVETKVELLFDAAQSPSLTQHQRGLIMERLASRIGNDGILRIVAQESRSQWRNREDAIKRFADLLRNALKVRKKRIKTSSTHAGKQKRLDEKKRRGKIKQSRKFTED